MRSITAYFLSKLKNARKNKGKFYRPASCPEGYPQNAGMPFVLNPVALRAEAAENQIKPRVMVIFSSRWLTKN